MILALQILKQQQVLKKNNNPLKHGQTCDQIKDEERLNCLLTVQQSLFIGCVTEQSTIRQETGLL